MEEIFKKSWGKWPAPLVLHHLIQNKSLSKSYTKELLDFKKENEELKFLLKTAYSQNYDTKKTIIRKLPEIPSRKKIPHKTTFENFKGIVSYLNGTYYTDKENIEKRVLEFFETLTEYEYNAYRTVLEKKLVLPVTKGYIFEFTDRSIATYTTMKPVEYDEYTSFPVAVEPYIEGVRVIVTFTAKNNVIITTTKGERLPFKRLEKELEKLGKTSAITRTCFDAILVNPANPKGTKRLISNYINKGEFPKKYLDSMVLKIIDIFPYAKVFYPYTPPDFKLPYYERRAPIKAIFGFRREIITPVDSYIANSCGELGIIIDDFPLTSNGNEAIIKNPHSFYQFGVSREWKHYKGKMYE